MNYEPVADFCKLMLLVNDLDASDTSEVMAGSLLALGRHLELSLGDKFLGVTAHSAHEELQAERTSSGFSARRRLKSC
jgi:hypothetical protein